MKRTRTAALTTVGAVCAVLTTTSLAQAQQKQEFGQQGEFILSADRLFPFFSYSHVSIDNPTTMGVTKNVDTASQTSLSFFYGTTGQAYDAFYTVPRLGFDYTIIPNVTLGGDLVLFFTLGSSAGNETDSAGGGSTTTSGPAPKATIFGIAPRGGYILGLNNMFSLWLRGGLSFYTGTEKESGNNGNGNTTTSATLHQFSLDLDPQLVITPIPHLGFTAGLTLDIPFAGGDSTEVDNGGTSNTFSSGASVLFFGVTVGMLGYF